MSQQSFTPEKTDWLTCAFGDSQESPGTVAEFVVRYSFYVMHSFHHHKNRDLIFIKTRFDWNQSQSFLSIMITIINQMKLVAELVYFECRAQNEIIWELLPIKQRQTISNKN